MTSDPMTFRRLILSSLRFHWRSHAGVVLGAAVGSAALIGALVVGDSVRESLKDRAVARLGAVEVALQSGDRLFGADLAPRMGPALAAAAVLHLRGTAARQDGSARANEVQIIGATPEFWAFSPGIREEERSSGAARSTTGAGAGAAGTGRLERPAPGRVRLNAALARQLKAAPGETVILRFPKPSALSQDAVLSPRNEASGALRLVVEEVVDADGFGDFSLKAGQRPALNAFVNGADLARATGTTNRANVLLVRDADREGQGAAGRRWGRQALARVEGGLPAAIHAMLQRSLDPLTVPSPAETQAMLETASGQLARLWRLADAEIEVRVVEPTTVSTGGEAVPPMVEVATRRIFLDRATGSAALAPAALGEEVGARPVLTYLANAIRSGARLTPYSMVTAAGAPWTPPDLRDDEIVVNEWLARDLGVAAGDSVELTYYDPEAGARLVERTQRFTVRGIVSLRGVHADRTLMPEFPGLAKAETTSDWDAGFPLVHRIRDEDEAYWKAHRGTPKAFVTLRAGQAMWGNRFGELTAVRYLVPAHLGAEEFRQRVEAVLVTRLRPPEVGLVFQPVRTEALRAATSGQDFGGLFLGFSLFLVVAALLLMALLFQFGLEQRLPEAGTLLALGFRPGRVRRIWLGEAVVLAGLGGLAGLVGGVVYAGAMIDGLTRQWRDAVGGTPLAFHATLSTLAIGWVASVLVAAVTIWLTMRRQFARPARELLAGGFAAPRIGVRSRGGWVGGVTTVAAMGLVGWAVAAGETANPGVFFGAGSLLLVAGLAWAGGWMARRGTGGSEARVALSVASLAVRGTARRRSRSLATAGLLASGTFLIAAIGAFRMDATREADRRASGTGGFALIGEASLPVSQDLNTPAGMEFYGLGTNDLPGVSFVAFRVREGDDASCLNLNRAQRPRLLGVRPELLAGRGAFAFAALERGLGVTNGWLALRAPSPDGPAAVSGDPGREEGGDAATRAGVPEIPAIGDAASIQWALGKKIGDTLELTDEAGRPFRLRLVAGVANSILQGNLVIDEAAFLRLFPGETGYRWFLVDVPPDRREAVSGTLSRALEDVGMEWTPAFRRLAEFNAVQNTYLSTFQVLGGLGLLLGSAGLGVVVLRNVLERRGELALLTAVGFRHARVSRMVLLEHAALLLLGLGIGLASAAVAVLPSLLAPTMELPVRSLGLTLGGVLVVGMATTWAATLFSVRGSLLEALRGE